jgi:hypothetical protein
MKWSIVERHRKNVVAGWDFRFVLFGKWKIYRSLSDVDLIVNDVPWWIKMLGWISDKR